MRLAKGAGDRLAGDKRKTGEKDRMENIYLALVDTPGIFASLIRRVTGINYIHVVLSLDEELQEAYSVGRRNPAIPIFAGFEKEDTEKIERQFPTAQYKVLALECTKEQKMGIARQLKECYEKRFQYRYCILGLPMILLNIPFYQKNHYTCSSFTANILQENGIALFDKHFSLVTPRDFFELEQTKMVYEGTLQTFNRLNGCYPVKRRNMFRQMWRKLSYAVNGVYL